MNVKARVFEASPKEFYDTTIVQFCVPEDLAIEANGLGRFTAMEDGQGRRIETTYNDTLPPLGFHRRCG